MTTSNQAPRGIPSTACTAQQPGSASSGPAQGTERLAYSVDEAAQLTGLSRDLLYDEMRRGRLTYVKIGRRRLITRQHLEQFLGLPSGTATSREPQ